jgi:Fe-S cluster assembly iron-binding protein IscA
MDIAREPYATDETIEIDGLKLYLDLWAQKILSQATIDYAEGYGFTITGASEIGSTCS